jgi:hypothetical protein
LLEEYGTSLKRLGKGAIKKQKNLMGMRKLQRKKKEFQKIH